MHLGNTNSPLGDSTIWLKLLAQKRETGKQIIVTLYYKY